MLVGPVTGGVPAGTPFFVTEGDDMPKPFMTYDQQLQKMRDKHLIISDGTVQKIRFGESGIFLWLADIKIFLKIRRLEIIVMVRRFRILSHCTNLTRACGSLR